jgi:hypothetical protein
MGINIGITITIQDPKKESFFSNGIRQNVITLRDIYEKCKNINKSYIINVAKVDPNSYKNTSWEPYSDNIISIEEAEKMCDLFVVCHGSVSFPTMDRLKKNGKKIVKQVLGAERSVFDETVLFKEKPSGIFQNNPHVDAAWVSPHFYERDRFFLETRYRCPVYEAPYIWDARFIEGHLDLYRKNNPGKKLEYFPKLKEKTISVIEPNINMVKTCTIPIVICELFFRQNPEMIKKAHIFGSYHIKTKKDMVDFVINLDIQKAKKISFESRYPIVKTLIDHTDILLSHQSGCELNYAYLDAAWLGYPVIHNSPLMKDLGWYYPGNNARIAIEHLKYVVTNFDNIEYPKNKYLNKSRDFAYQYTIDNPKNIEGYEILIDKVLEKKC